MSGFCYLTWPQWARLIAAYSELVNETIHLPPTAASDSIDVAVEDFGELLSDIERENGL